MKQQVEKFIPLAIELIREVGIANEKGEVPSEFNGYFSSFGAAVVQSGLKPALAFFSNEERVKERSKILKAVYKLVTGNQATNAGELLDHVIRNADKEESLKANIIDAAVALKLAVRTYKLKKNA